MNKLFSGLAVALAGVCAFAETYSENATVSGDEPLMIAAGGATDAACWSCVVDGDELKLIRSVGTMILLR